MTMMDAALKYAEANIPVIPLHWICEDGSCSCKKGQQCDSKGKHPLYTGWYKNSTADVEQIRKWWTKTPYANIGIPTGEKSGWLVLDVDDGGDETISALEATHGKLPDTVTAVTGSGGRHYVFKYPKGRSIPNKTKFAPGLDTRSTGGLIVVAPSIHVSGNRYEWIKDHSPFDRTPAEAPEWLLKLMEKVEVLLTPFEGSSIAAEIKEGSRNSTLTSLAGTMRARGMTEESIYAALLAENNARCNPPLDEVEVRKIAHSVSRYQPNLTGKKHYH
ncbi:bifunctional DNA primase/polymerase [Acetivibrio saccincola]|uniref:bifunctional DNA primase/polymerase n=1 Tax=Acetivibrio saccincola TaxID=1677857 RepID=UPI001F3C2EF0|nr:bifunctional DNA primase/polymerase [Acetivibrio saccincola]